MYTAHTYHQATRRRTPEGRRRAHHGIARSGFAAVAVLLALGLTACEVSGSTAAGGRSDLGGAGSADAEGDPTEQVPGTHASPGPHASADARTGVGEGAGDGVRDERGDGGAGASPSTNTGAASGSPPLTDKGGATSGSAASTAPTASTALPTRADTRASSRCTAKQLTMTLGRPDPAAGNVHYDLAFTNNGRTSCSLRGFPGVSVRRGDGARIGAPATHEGGARGIVRLGAGQTAHATLHTLNRGVKGGSCWETPAMLQAYPPGSRESMTLRSSSPRVCGNTFTVTSIASSAAGS